MTFLMVLLFLFISSLSGFYLSSKKFFMVIPNERYNNMAVKSLLLVPWTTLVISVLSLMPIYLTETIHLYLASLAGEYIFLMYPTFFTILFVYLFRAYALRNDTPPEHWDDFMDRELYLFSPHNKITYARAFFTKYEMMPKDKNGMAIKRQKEDLIMDYRLLDKADMSFTADGEILVNEKAVDVLRRYGLTGFDLRPVKPFKGKLSKNNHQYFQLVCCHTMPEMSSKTNIVLKKSPAVCIPDNLIYYSSSVMDNAFDIRQTYEIFAEDRYVQDINTLNRRMWIVSKKAMLILLKHFDQEKRFFVPVQFTDDDVKDNVSERNKDEND